MVDSFKRRAGKNLSAIMYPDLALFIVLVSHYPELSVPSSSDRKQPSSEDSGKSDEKLDSEDPGYNFRGAAGERNPYYASQKDLNYLIRDLDLTKSNAELLTSGLKEWDLLDESVQVASQGKCNGHFSNFFTRQDGFCFCNNVSGLCEASGIAFNPNEWRLFIDSTSSSLCSSITGISIGLFLSLIRCNSQSKASASTKIHWTLNAATKECITKA